MATTQSTYTVSNYILDRLKELGVRHFFEVPGDYASKFLLTLENDPGIAMIPNINELGVGYAADGYGRFVGAAACSVQYGVGTFSLLNGTAGSWVERVPVAIIGPSPSTQNRVLTETQGILFHHSTGDLEADQLVMENVTVASVVLDNSKTAPALIDEALTAMITHRRPVYIEGYANVFGETCIRPIGTLTAREPESDPQYLGAMIEAAWARIEAAKLPVFFAGVEIQRWGLQPLLQSLIEASGISFTTTSLGKTVLDESQRAFIGTYAGPASPALTRAVMAETDCPITLGAIITDDYLDFMQRCNDRIIWVNDELARVGVSEYAFVYLKDFMEGLLNKFRESDRYPRKLQLPKVPKEIKPPVLNVQPLTYERFYQVMGNWLIKEGQINDAKLILGESTSLYVFGNLMGMPQNSFVAQAAWGSLGHETGCALGVELATGARPIVVAGDGGFMMICQEISSLVRQKSNALIFVMSNEGYAIEQSFVDICAFTPSGQYAQFDLLPKWDYVALAKAFGAKGHEVKTVGQLRRLLRKLETREGVPHLIKVTVPLKDIPPQLYRLATDGNPPHCKEEISQF